MSIERDVMQFLLNILRNGIVSSSTRQQIGRTPFDKLSTSDLPFVQVFAPIVDLSEEAQQQPGVLTFVVEIIDRVTRKDALRDQLEALDTTLRLDSSFQGLVQKGFVAARAVAETGDDKRAIASATIVVQLKDTLLATPFTNVLDFADASDFDPLGATVEDSKIILGRLGVRRDTPSAGAMVIQASVVSGALPGTIDLNGIRRIRTLLYLTPEYGDALMSLTLSLFVDDAATDGGTFAPASELVRQSNGWQYHIHKIQLPPDVTFGAGLGDRSAIRVIRFTWGMVFASTFSSTRFGLIMAQFGYHLRDTGVNAESGYHSDIP